MRDPGRAQLGPRGIEVSHRCARAAFCASVQATTLDGLSGFKSTATRVAAGMISLRSSSRFPLNSECTSVSPVTFPPGCGGWPHSGRSPLDHRRGPGRSGSSASRSSQPATAGVLSVTMTSTFERTSSRGELAELVVPTVRPLRFDDEVSTLFPVAFAQPLLERIEPTHGLSGRRVGGQKSDVSDLRRRLCNHRGCSEKGEEQGKCPHRMT